MHVAWRDGRAEGSIFDFEEGKEKKKEKEWAPASEIFIVRNSYAKFCTNTYTYVHAFMIYVAMC